jgi:phosphate starvation-inducible PhoH-like protein
MTEKVFELENIDPHEFFGVRNNNIKLIGSFYPKLIVVGRGHAIKVKGESKEIKNFTAKFQLLIEHYNHFSSLKPDIIKNIMLGSREGIGNELAEGNNILLYGNSGKPIKARTKNQKRLVEACKEKDMSFAIGPAGSGKTYTAIAMAVRALKNREVKKIILSRPAVEAGENLGFLPGDLKEKIDPYLQPLYDALSDMIPAKKLEELMNDGVIQIAPLAFMRGRTLNNAFVILDEAQNTTTLQLKMFLTRMGLYTRYVITGDITQIDLPKKQNSGLITAMKILSKIKEIAIIEFDKDDIVRHQLVKDIVDAYEKMKNED